MTEDKQKTVTDDGWMEVKDSAHLDAVANEKDRIAIEYAEVSPLDIINTDYKLRYGKLAKTEITLENGKKIKIRQITQIEKTKAFVLGWVKYSETSIYKKVWEGTRKKDFDTEIVFEAGEREIYMVADMEVDKWIVYFAMRDFYPEIKALPDDEGIKIVENLDSIIEIMDKVKDELGLSEQAERVLNGFR